MVVGIGLMFSWPAALFVAGLLLVLSVTPILNV